MSDEVTPPEGGKEAEGQEFKAPASQEELNRIIESRLSRERAKYADYDEIKNKAAEFDKVSEASKTELQKANERAEAAERRAAEFEAKEQRAGWADEVSKATGVPAAALRGSTKEELEAHAETLKALITPERPKRTTTPPGKAEPESGKGRAAAALREMRRGA